jgi:hypothetical protein
MTKILIGTKEIAPAKVKAIHTTLMSLKPMLTADEYAGRVYEHSQALGVAQDDLQAVLDKHTKHVWCK